MKKNKIIVLSLALLFLVACDDNEYVAPLQFSDVSWYISLPSTTDSISAGNSISFMDVSVGALSHEWTIEEGNYYLKPVFSASDTLVNFIDHTYGITNTASTIHVLFSNPGISKVRLRNTFSEQVTYNGTNRSLKAVLDTSVQPNVWVIDTTFVYRVK